MPHDPSDPRRPDRRRAPRPTAGPGWTPYPGTVTPSRGTPHDDFTPWWRLQPGERGRDGVWVRRGIVHGGTCSRWPTGQAPPGWTWHTRPQVRAMLDQDADYIPCPVCCVAWLWAIWPRTGLGPRQFPTAET